MGNFPFNENRGYVHKGDGLPAEFGHSTLSAGRDGGILRSILSAKYEITQQTFDANEIA